MTYQKKKKGRHILWTQKQKERIQEYEIDRENV